MHKYMYKHVGSRHYIHENDCPRLKMQRVELRFVGGGQGGGGGEEVDGGGIDTPTIFSWYFSGKTRCKLLH